MESPCPDLLEIVVCEVRKARRRGVLDHGTPILWRDRIPRFHGANVAFSDPQKPGKPTDAEGVDDGTETGHSPSLQDVASGVNTARSGLADNLPDMAKDPRKQQGRRLAKARRDAGYSSARAAAIENDWAESTYRAHENGSRTIGHNDAEKYAARFRHAGVRVTARDILFGEELTNSETETTGLASGTVPFYTRRTQAKAEANPSNAGPRVEIEQRQNQRIPVLGRGVGGDEGRYIMNGEAIDYVPSLVGLEDVPGAYAVYVEGSSMVPKYEAGDLVYIHPTKPLRKDCYVLVQIKGATGSPPSGYIKRFVHWTKDRLVLRQLSPDQEVSFDRNAVVSVHRIVGSTES